MMASTGASVVISGVLCVVGCSCSKTHLPGYVAAFETFKAAGAEVIVCVCPNDVFVTAACTCAYVQLVHLYPSSWGGYVAVLCERLLMCVPSMLLW
jgi:peroxiredoxin